MATDIEQVVVDFQHTENTIIASFVVEDLSFLSNVDVANQQFKEEIKTHRPSRLVIDFEGVQLISSVGISILVDVLVQLNSYGGQAGLCNVSGAIRTALQVTHLDHAFKIFPDRQAAMVD